MGASLSYPAICVSRDVSKRAPEQENAYYVDYSKGGPWFTNSPDGVMKPRLAARGLASAEGTPPTTLPRLLAEAACSHAAFMVERPVPPLAEDGKPPEALPLEQWKKWTWAEVHAEVRSAAAGFVKLGFQQFDSVNVWGFNSPEWIMAAVTASFAGGKVAGLYPTDSPDTAAYKVQHSCGSIVVVDDKGKITKLAAGLKERGPAPRIKAIVTWGFEPAADETIELPGSRKVPLMSWNSVVELGKSSGSEFEVDRRIAATEPGHCAGLIYTSGTTGEPKAVMISHDNIVYESSVVLDMLKPTGFGTTEQGERCLSYLPLSHVAGMMVDIVSPIGLTARGPSHLTIYFARPYDLKAGSVKDRLCAARPTIFLGVPLVWEKIADKMRTLGASVSSTKKAIADWAKGLGLAHAQECQLGGSGAYPVGYGLANSLVLSNVKAALGLDECKFGFTGAAPIRVDTLEYFGSLGLQINEVYGMSECTGACTFSLDNCHQWGSCGFEMPGQEVRAFKVDDTNINSKKLCPPAPDLSAVDEEYQGELCFRGRNVMMGYMACPDMGSSHIAEIKKKTAEAIDDEGWLHSGDKGMVTSLGMVKITGRYKELIIGDGGENIAPVPIEDHVKKTCDGICEIMMVGDKRKYNVALVTLKAVGANGESPGTNDLDAGAKRINPEVQTISAAMDDSVWIEAVTKAIQSANKNPKVCLNTTYSIQKFTILPSNFSEENGELTPTKKLKRKKVEERYAAIIEKMYATNGLYIRYE